MKPSFSLFVNSRPLSKSTPRRLFRKANQAAILEFDVPREDRPSRFDYESHVRQGDIIELYYGLGTGQQRIFYGFIPSEGSDRDMDEGAEYTSFTATDFIGQLQSRIITLGDSGSSFLNPVGQEIGGFIATLVQDSIDLQYTTNAFSNRGVRGTSPAEFVTEENAIYGTKTAKKFLDDYTAIPNDDSIYPNTPLKYEYHQRDAEFIWRKQFAPIERSTVTSQSTYALAPTPALTLTLGKDAILTGTIRKQPVYTDALATTKTGEQFHHADRDSNRRWGGRRFIKQLSTTSSFSDDARTDAIREVERRKHETRSFSMVIAKDAFFLYPGDLVRLNAGEAFGISSGMYRVAEVAIDLSPTLKTTVTVGEPLTLLTDYL